MLAMIALLRTFLLFVAAVIASIHLYFLAFRASSNKTLVVLGSGGHTTEMEYLLTLPKVLDTVQPVHYIMARGDNLSRNAALRVSPSPSPAHIHFITRSRKVHQPYFTAIFTTLVATLEAAWLILRLRPRLVIANGPGTSLPIICLARLFRAFFSLSVNVVYIESFTRIKRLSTTARLSSWAIDTLVVNWKQLAAGKNMVHIQIHQI